MLVKTFGAAVQGINATITTYIVMHLLIIYVSLSYQISDKYTIH